MINGNPLSNTRPGSQPNRRAGNTLDDWSWCRQSIIVAKHLVVRDYGNVSVGEVTWGPTYYSWKYSPGKSTTQMCRIEKIIVIMVRVSGNVVDLGKLIAYLHVCIFNLECSRSIATRVQGMEGSFPMMLKYSYSPRCCGEFSREIQHW